MTDLLAAYDRAAIFTFVLCFVTLALSFANRARQRFKSYRVRTWVHWASRSAWWILLLGFVWLFVSFGNVMGEMDRVTPSASRTNR